jgi:hypothetical protein
MRNGMPLSTGDLNKLDKTIEETLDKVGEHDELAPFFEMIQDQLAGARKVVTSQKVAARRNGHEGTGSDFSAK